MAIPGYVMAFALVGALEYTGSFQTYLRESFSLSLLLPDIYSFGGEKCLIKFSIISLNSRVLLFRL